YGRCNFRDRHAAALKLAAEVRLEACDAGGVPAAEFVIGDALEPAVNDGADLAGGFADPGEFDRFFFAALVGGLPGYRRRKLWGCEGGGEAAEEVGERGGRCFGDEVGGGAEVFLGLPP